MVVDVHSHAWQWPDHFTDGFRRQVGVARPDKEIDLTVTFESYANSAPRDTKTIVFGGKAYLSGIWVDDRYVAQYAAAQPNRLIGFLSLDPTRKGWEEEMRYGHEELGLQGIKLMPMYAGFRPCERWLDPLWTYAQERELPVLLHTGTTFVSQAPLECTLPRHLDPVAIRFPELKMILAHLGHPYENECIAVIRKHPNLFADISALHYRPFQLYHSLMLVQEYGVWPKLLLGSDYPFTTVNATLEALYSLNENLGATGAGCLQKDEIDNLIRRDSLKLLGLNGSSG